MNEVYSYNSEYLLCNGKPWFPVMGEMHYSRFHPDLWEESLRKMKAGGVSVVSIYVIWIHHEEEEGVFDFSGCRNLRRYLQLVQKVGLRAFLRLGPWVHGEVRNGGFPDWLQQKEGEITLRSDDARYLAYVRRYWTQVAGQVSGLMQKDGGPVIGAQIENEYGHVGGLHGAEGEAHMRTLTALAKELGVEVSLYTATGWGGACTGGLLPVMGGYCEAPWDQSVKELAPNTNFVFSTVRNDALIACDHHVDDAVTFDESKFPFLTAELGGGLQVTKHRRPVATGTDIGAMSLTKLGSGVALLGYYMYHGGSNPEGKLSTLQESRATGYLNDLPEINYDFNAPIRQFGTISDSYREVRLLALFLEDFGEGLAAMRPDILPENVKPDDFHTLRTACRHNDESGYVFFNNYQRRYKMDAHPAAVLTGRCAAGDVEFPAVDIAEGDYAFFPYHMKLGEAVLRSALATPLCRLHTAAGEVYVFYGDRDPQFAWETEARAEVLHLTRAEALHAAKVTLAQDYLVLTEDYVWAQDGALVVTGGEAATLRTFPALPAAPHGFVCRGTEGAFTVYAREASLGTVKTALTLSEETEDTARYTLTLCCPDGFCTAADRVAGRDAVLCLVYAAESMDVFCDGKKINDYFYTGQPAVLSLGYFGFPKELSFVLHALHAGDEEKLFLEKWPAMAKGRACRIDGVTVELTARG